MLLVCTGRGEGSRWSALVGPPASRGVPAGRSTDGDHWDPLIGAACRCGVLPGYRRPPGGLWQDSGSVFFEETEPAKHGKYKTDPVGRVPKVFTLCHLLCLRLKRFLGDFQTQPNVQHPSSSQPSASQSPGNKRSDGFACVKLLRIRRNVIWLAYFKAWRFWKPLSGNLLRSR